MLKNYLKTALRSVLKNKIFSIINVLGLAIGLTACLLITQYVLHENSYDNFHSRKTRIFRVQQDRLNKGVITTQWAAGCAGIGWDLIDNFPEVERVVVMRPAGVIVRYEDTFHEEPRSYLASDDFFRVFSHKLISGVDSLVLREPYSAVLSQSTARKYFGDDDPIGKRISVDGNMNFEVKGVFEDVPENTHMKFDALFSYSTFLQRVGDQARTAWQWDGFYTYVLLKEGADVKALESKLPAYVEKREGEELRQYNAGMVFHFQPVTDIHLTSDYMMEFEPNGSKQSVTFLAIIAVFILVIAWINYVNLSTAKSMERAREVGVRKVMGSMRSQLVRQFMLESFIINLVGFVIALGLVWLLMPAFAEITGRNLDLSYFANPYFWLGVVVIFLTGMLLAGLYPAVVLSGFKPVSVLKGRLQNSARGIILRKGLVVFQFVASITLIVGTFTVYSQLNFMQSSDLGVDIEQTLVVKGPGITDSTYNSRFEGFKNNLLNYPDVQNVTTSTGVPGRQPGWNAGGIRLLTQAEDESNQYRVLGVGYDFVDAFGLDIVAGRSFSKDFPNDEATVLFNESGVKVLGFDNPEEALDKEINFWGDTFKIVGVLKDYHQESLKKGFEPLVFRCIPNAQSFFSVKMKTQNVQQVIDRAAAAWEESFSGNPFDYFFLDQYYQDQYEADQQFGKVFGLFSLLAIFIACLGLFGLSSYTVVQRTKEIGIRKVLGASVRQVVLLLCKDYTYLILVAMIIAVPLSWYVMNNWLNDFATRIGLVWWIFAAPSVVVLMIAWFTIGGHTLRAASSNPVDSLRYE